MQLDGIRGAELLPKLGRGHETFIAGNGRWFRGFDDGDSFLAGLFAAFLGAGERSGAPLDMWVLKALVKHLLAVVCLGCMLLVSFANGSTIPVHTYGSLLEKLNASCVTPTERQPWRLTRT